MGAPIVDPRPTIPTQAKRCLSARRGQSTADGGAKPRAEAFETSSGVLGGRRKRRLLQSRLTSSP